LVNFNLGPDDGAYLDWLCINKEIRLFKLSHLSILAGKINDGQGKGCDQDVKDAILSLKNVVDANEGKECSMEAFENYKQFYVKYLDKSDKSTKVVKLPKQLVDYALAYGAQLSAQCRTNMVKQLLNAASDIVKPEYFDAIKELIEPDGPIAETLGCTNQSPDEVLLPIDAEALRGKGQQQQPKRKITLNCRTAPMIRRIKRRCELQFKPVYAPLMMPVTHLANLGFNHRGEELDSMLESGENRDVIGRWSRIAFMCEILGQMELVQEQADAEKSEGATTAQMLILTQDEATCALRRPENQSLLDNDNHVEPVNFEPTLSADIPEEMLTSELKRVVKGIKTSNSEVDNIRTRYWSVMKACVWQEVKQLRAGPVLGQVYKEMTKSGEGDETVDLSTELVKSLDALAASNTEIDKIVRLEPLTIISILMLSLAAALFCLKQYMHAP
jgi:hypothetical protein